MAQNSKSRWMTFSHALPFVLGFAIVFVIGWGGAARVLGAWIYDGKEWLAHFGSIVTIAFGLHTLGMFRIPFVNYDVPEPRSTGVYADYALWAFMGGVFAAGWTPCISATLSVTQASAARAMLLSSGYALGLGIPFLLISLLIDRAVGAGRVLRRHLRVIQIVSGLLMTGMGVLLLTEQVFTIATWAQRGELYLDVGFSGVAPSYSIAMLGGLLSFLSPCVLPLVPAYVSYLGEKLPQQN